MLTGLLLLILLESVLLLFIFTVVVFFICFVRFAPFGEISFFLLRAGTSFALKKMKITQTKGQTKGTERHEWSGQRL